MCARYSVPWAQRRRVVRAFRMDDRKQREAFNFSAPLAPKTLQNVMAITDVLALFLAISTLPKKGHCHDDTRNSGPGLRHRYRCGADNGLWIWSSPTKLTSFPDR